MDMMNVRVYGSRIVNKINRKNKSFGALEKMSTKDLIGFLYIGQHDNEKVEFIIVVKKRNGKTSKDEGYRAHALRKNTLKFGDLLMDFDFDCMLDDEETKLIFPCGNFLTYSTFIETLSSHLCSIQSAKNCSHLFIRQRRYMQFDQMRRIDKLEEIILISEKDKEIEKNEIEVIKAMRMIAEIRNQIAHSFLPNLLIFKEKAYFTFDQDLHDILQANIKNSIILLVNYYKAEQERFLMKNKDDICNVFNIAFDDIAFDGKTYQLFFAKK